MQRLIPARVAALGGLALFLLFANGCAIATRRLEVGPVRHIVPGKSTRADVEPEFGNPKSLHIGSNGRKVARYTFHEIAVSHDANPVNRRDHPGHVLLRTLTLLYDRNEVVEKKLHDESFTPIVRTRTGWLEAGPELDTNSIRFIVKGKTTVPDLIQHLGEPQSRSLWMDGLETLSWYRVRDRGDRLGKPEGKLLDVGLDANGRVADFTLGEFEHWLWW